MVKICNGLCLEVAYVSINLYFLGATTIISLLFLSCLFLPCAETCDRFPLKLHNGKVHVCLCADSPIPIIPVLIHSLVQVTV